ncbi:Ribosomal protein S18 acetylase RimI [Vannielia litorea]|uniref:Ribosomal protein S18 acetylase RimI n=2 Tax=Vannielia litorea TaxID=1217970 RepID=A0A1N6G8T6_9RHOB|nr:Ribosomal protein S18 acetylase RimI [Vannielia litorea]
MTAAIRPATRDDAPALAEAQVAAWHATYPGMVPPPMLEAMTVARRAPLWVRILEAGQSVTLVSEAGGLTGFVSVGAQRTERHKATYAGEIYALYIHPEAQGQGHGAALMRAGAARLRAAGHGAASLWVMSGNARARRFYEHLGGALLEEQTVPVEGGSFDEVAYGWRDLSPLAGK